MALVNVLPVSVVVLGPTTCETGSLSSVVVASGPSSLGAVADDLTPFEREKMAFLQTKPYLEQYAGQFVAIHGGQVAAADQSRNGVLRKFFGKYPAGTSVYVGFVGPRPIARVTGPLVVRSSF